MDVIGSFAAVTQLAGQLVNLAQQIFRARETIRRAPKAIEDLDSQLWRLFNTSKQVADEPALQIKTIHEALEDIYDIALELQANVERMRKQQSKNRAFQLLHALVLGQRDESVLTDIVGRLRDAQDTLGHRINVAHVGTTAGMVEVVNRIEAGVVSIRRDVHGKVDQPQLDISNNMVGAATQENSIDVWEGVSLSRGVIKDNQAWNGSWQRNAISIGSNAIKCTG
ncbi:uncharacterized protein B0T15DRAFT_508221 [Chaetomium strumarium]|uniref:NACHT-NTPase and P-loop NTPases N-terminal domain-containing protein n=1 Tax=Chaetomium strumarium TaxID=1170767 RepID=A0AAJ0H4Q3_9PEZI|nr:hypothetical protein B0T15DRAFT_508221 [Chaetomium strumarium]